MTTSTSYTPPAGFQFRLCGKASWNVLYSSTTLSPAVFHTSQNDVQENQWLYLIHGSGPRAGKCAIKGYESGKVIFSRRHNEPFVDHIEGNGDYDDNWHIFESIDRFPGYFRIITPAPANVALVSRTTLEPNVFNHPAKEFYEDQLFRFIFEEVEVVSVDWKLKDSTTSPSRVFTNSVFQNDSAVSDEFLLNHPCGDGSAPRLVSRAVWKGGFPLDPDMKITSGLPNVTEGRLVIGEKIEWSIGTPVIPPEQTNGLSDIEYKLVVPPQYKMRATATTRAGCEWFNLPFTVTVRGKRSGVKATANGIWNWSTSVPALWYEVKEVMN